MAQLTYSTDFSPVNTGLSQVRNNDVILAFRHDMGAGTNIEEALFYLRDTDDDVVVLAITLEDNASQWTWPEDDNGKLAITAANTKELTADGNYEHGILLKDTSGRYLSPTFGGYAIIDEVVHEGGQTNAPLTWATRQELQDSLSQQLAASGAALVLTAAAASATSIETDDITDAIIAVGITAGNDLYIALDAGSQVVANADISDVTDGVITLDGDTLDDTVAAGRLVRLIP